MANGDLRSFLRNTHRVFSVVRMTRFAEDICSGMIYLHGKNIIHRDLAARNIFVDGKEVAKIGDFGLSRDLHAQDYANYYYAQDKNRMLPIKWMAPESITSGKFSKKGDVWSFGVLLWEIFTRGENPYPGLPNNHLIVFLQSGKRLSKNDVMTGKLYEIMMRCWNYNAKSRPNFVILKNQLKLVFEENICQKTRAIRTQPISEMTSIVSFNLPQQSVPPVLKNSVTRYSRTFESPLHQSQYSDNYFSHHYKHLSFERQITIKSSSSLLNFASPVKTIRSSNSQYFL